jgi:hypothetical protein
MAKKQTAKKSALGCTVDFDQPGRQVGFIRLMWSDNKHAGGVIPVPIAVIANGKGPTILITGGTHGNEYEGQIIVQRLIRELDPASVSGRLILMPAHNYLAVMDDKRCAEADDVNLNRIFPGDPNGGPTEQIAYFVETVILPLCDYGMDLHTGGNANDMPPCGYLRIGGSAALMKKKVAMAEAFAAPLTVVVSKTSSTRSVSAACDRQGVASLATELGGGNTVSREAMAIGTEGVNRVLRQIGILAADPADKDAPKTRYIEYGDSSCFTIAPSEGLFEPYCTLGDTVKKGQKAGCVHSLEAPELVPTEVTFSHEGLIVMEHIHAPVKRGDYLFCVATDTEASALAG